MVAVALFVAVSLVLAVGSVATAVLAAARVDLSGTTSTWVDGMRPEVRNAATGALLTRRADAVRAKDKAAFLADIATTDAAFLRRQEVVFENLTRLPLAELAFVLEPKRQYDHLIDTSLSGRFQSLVSAPGVTVRYRIDGIDSVPVTAPWVPVFGLQRGRWMLVGDLLDSALPYGTRGQPWDGGPIEVLRSERVVVVISASDTARGRSLLEQSEAALTKVARVRPSGWDGRVLLTAVQDQRIFDAYFGDSPERVAKVAAIAVPYYDRVPDWHDAPAYATTRVVFNPRELSAPAAELAHDLTHEFAHAALGPVTGVHTPRWVVEGLAEYIAFKGTEVDPAQLRNVLKDVDVSAGLPADADFYANAHNYATAWVACRMIAEKYGEKKLLAYYESFQREPSEDANARSMLGVTSETLVAEWQETIRRLRG
ncbi:MAG TPA: hypothetical protein VK453_13810 [Micromonosporaceae bacterium]|nr:hypothetical protein [Micromonosporaceae bacterium]